VLGLKGEKGERILRMKKKVGFAEVSYPLMGTGQ